MTECLHFHFHALENEMTTHSSVLAWRIPGTGHPAGLPSMGLHRVDTTEVTQQQQQQQVLNISEIKQYLSASTVCWNAFLSST